MSAQPNTEEKRQVPWHGVSTELSSFTSFGVVTLSNGQRVNVQSTGRHGLSAEKLYEDFKNYIKFLDLCAQDHEVEFWDGKKSEGQGNRNGSEPKDEEPQYTRVDGNGHPVENVFPAGTLTVEYKNGKEYFKVTDASGAVLPGVTVTTTQTDTGIARTAVTNETGNYVLSSLPVGPYRLEATLQGFRTFAQENIRLQVIKNSLARRVFGEMGIKASDPVWAGPTTVAWGATSLSELSRELDTAFKKNDKVKFKGAVAEGQEVTFEQALKMPTKAEAIGRVRATIDRLQDAAGEFETSHPTLFGIVTRMVDALGQIGI